jgi:hypothetical protein
MWIALRDVYGMYKDISAVTKVGFNHSNTAYPVLTHHVLSGMEKKSHVLFHDGVNATDNVVVNPVVLMLLCCLKLYLN